MRNIKTTDVFQALRIINKADFREDFQKLVEKANSDEFVNYYNLGIDAMLAIADKMTSVAVEKAVYDFLKGPLECTAEEVKEMDLLEAVEGIAKAVDIEGWKAFFKSVSGMLNVQK